MASSYELGQEEFPAKEEGVAPEVEVFASGQEELVLGNEDEAAGFVKREVRGEYGPAISIANTFSSGPSRK
jgi:hypothetical protein